MVEWEKLESFERHEKINNILKKIGDYAVVEFLDNGKDVSADIISIAQKAKGIKGIKARDTVVFNIKTADGIMELWLSASNFSALRELSLIKKSSNNTLVGCKVRIERQSKDDTEKSALSFKMA